MKSKLLKRCLALMAFCMSAVMPAVADDFQSALVVWQGDQELYSFYVANNPTLKVSNGYAVVQSEGKWEDEFLFEVRQHECYFSIPMSESSNYKISLEKRDYMGMFGHRVPTSVEEKLTVTARPAFSIQGGVLHVAGLKGGEQVTVYTIDGKTAVQVKADSDGRASASLRQMSGTVIVKAGNVSFKVLIK